jgi:hypothetical protein
MTFNLRPDGDPQIWKIWALDETELGVERQGPGDAVAIVGTLDIRAETDKAGNKRIGFNVHARQVLFLRGRSVTRHAAMHDHQTMASGYARSPIG